LRAVRARPVPFHIVVETVACGSVRIAIAAEIAGSEDTACAGFSTSRSCVTTGAFAAARAGFAFVAHASPGARRNVPAGALGATGPTKVARLTELARIASPIPAVGVGRAIRASARQAVRGQNAGTFVVAWTAGCVGTAVLARWPDVARATDARSVAGLCVGAAAAVRAHNATHVWTRGAAAWAPPAEDASSAVDAAVPSSARTDAAALSAIVANAAARADSCAAVTHGALLATIFPEPPGLAPVAHCVRPVPPRRTGIARANARAGGSFTAVAVETAWIARRSGTLVLTVGAPKSRLAFGAVLASPETGSFVREARALKRVVTLAATVTLLAIHFFALLVAARSPPVGSTVLTIGSRPKTVDDVAETGTAPIVLVTSTVEAAGSDDSARARGIAGR